MSVSQNELASPPGGQVQVEWSREMVRKMVNLDLQEARDKSLFEWRLKPFDMLKKQIINSAQDKEPSVQALIEIVENTAETDEFRFCAFTLLTRIGEEDFTQGQLEHLAIRESPAHRAHLSKDRFLKAVREFWKTEGLQITEPYKAPPRSGESASSDPKKTLPELSGVKERLRSLFHLQVRDHKRIALGRILKLGLSIGEAAPLVDVNCYTHSISDPKEGSEMDKKGLTGYALFKSPTLFGGSNTQAFRRGLAVSCFDGLAEESAVAFFINKSTYNACESSVKAVRRKVEDKRKAVDLDVETVQTKSNGFNYQIEVSTGDEEVYERFNEWRKSVIPEIEARLLACASKKLSQGAEPAPLISEFAFKWQRAQHLGLSEEEYILSLEQD